MPLRKSASEDFAKFFEAPNRESLRDLLRNNFGEFPFCDFKEDWPPSAHLAPHVLALANSGGGCLVIGVAQLGDNSYSAIGLRTLTDKTEVLRGLAKYLPAPLQPEVLDFAYEASEYPALVGKRFQVLVVEDLPKHLPFVAGADGDKLFRNRIYSRRNTSSEEATYEELQRILSRRVDTGYSATRELTLDEQLEELENLYRRLRSHYLSKTGLQASVALALSGGAVVPDPTLGYADFLNRLIKKRETAIEALAQRGG